MSIICHCVAKGDADNATGVLLLTKGCSTVFAFPQSCDTDHACKGPIVTDGILARHSALYDSCHIAKIPDSVLTELAKQFHADHNRTPAPKIYEYITKKVFRVGFPLHLTYLCKSVAHWLRHNTEICRAQKGWVVLQYVLAISSYKEYVGGVTIWLRVYR